MIFQLVSSSKHVSIGNKLICIKNKSEVFEFESKRSKFQLDELKSGKFIFIFQLHILKLQGLDCSLNLKYKMGLHKGEQTVEISSNNCQFEYLKADLEYVNSKFLQLSLRNKFNRKDIVIQKAGQNFKRTLLMSNETLKVIVPESKMKEFQIEYQIKGPSFKSNHIQEIINDLQENSQCLQSIIIDSKKIVCNINSINKASGQNLIEISKFEIETFENLKVFDQKSFLFSYKLSPQIKNENSRFYIELKFQTDKYSIMGETKFLINNLSKDHLEMEGKLVN